eukprot:403376194
MDASKFYTLFYDEQGKTYYSTILGGVVTVGVYLAAFTFLCYVLTSVNSREKLNQPRKYLKISDPTISQFTVYDLAEILDFELRMEIQTYSEKSECLLKDVVTFQINDKYLDSPTYLKCTSKVIIRNHTEESNETFMVLQQKLQIDLEKFQKSELAKTKLGHSISIVISASHFKNSQLTFNRHQIDSNGNQTIRNTENNLQQYDGYNIYYVKVQPLIYKKTTSVFRSPIYTPHYDDTLLIHESTESSKFDIPNHSFTIVNFTLGSSAIQITETPFAVYDAFAEVGGLFKFLSLLFIPFFQVNIYLYYRNQKKFFENGGALNQASVISRRSTLNQIEDPSHEVNQQLVPIQQLNERDEREEQIEKILQNIKIKAIFNTKNIIKNHLFHEFAKKDSLLKDSTELFDQKFIEQYGNLSVDDV